VGAPAASSGCSRAGAGALALADGDEYAREADDAGGFADSMIVPGAVFDGLASTGAGVAAFFGAVAAGGAALKTGDSVKLSESSPSTSLSGSTKSFFAVGEKEFVEIEA
jgi:hypothetical protein